MFAGIARKLWGNLTADEIKKFGILAGTLFLIIGNYWFLRVMKNDVFNIFVGYDYQPRAKWASLVVVGLLVLVYSKLVDMFQKHVLFYIICTFYGLGFLLVAWLMAHPDFSFVAQDGVIGQALSWIPGKLLGWFSYVFLESYGSIIPALFWSFVASSTTTESAKRGYGMIMSLTQIGVVVGPLIVLLFVSKLGHPILFAAGGILTLMVPLIIKFYMGVVPQEDVVDGKATTTAKARTGFFEGIRLLFSHGYLMGVLAVATLYEIVGTILEFQMNKLGTEVYAGVKGGLSQLNASMGIAVGVLALVFATLGTSFFMRKFGLRFCLVAFPAIIGVVVTAVFFQYQLGATPVVLMWSFFVAMVIVKGMNYALNNPTKEVLYIPTSKDVKFKSKGWIDAFGNRSSKALGAGVTDNLGGAFSTLLVWGTVASLGIVGFWVIVAIFVGNKFNKLQEDQKIIE